MSSRQSWQMVVIAALAGFVGAAVALAMLSPRGALATEAQPAGGAEAVKARRFELVSATGQPRLVLETDKLGMPVIEMFDNRNIRRVMLAVGKGGTSLLLYDERGLNHAGLSVFPGGEPELYLMNQSERPLALLSAQPNGGALLALFATNGKPRATMAVLPDGSPVLNLLDKLGQPDFKAP